MPGGSGCRRRQTERFRARKNEDTMADIQAKIFDRLFGIKVCTEGKKADEVWELGILATEAWKKEQLYAAEIIACDAYQCDPTLIHACLDTNFIVSDNREINTLEYHVHQVYTEEGQLKEIDEQCVIPQTCEITNVPYEILEHSQCNVVECVEDQVVMCGGIEEPITHEQHSHHPIIYSGVKYRACNMLCICEEFPVSVLTRRQQDIQALNLFKNKRVCACLDRCDYAEDSIADYNKIRSVVVDYHLFSRGSLGNARQKALGIYYRLPIEIQLLIDQLLTCRERYLLMLIDSRKREGCSTYKTIPISYPYSFRQEKCSRTLTRCICMSIQYRFGITTGVGTALRSVSFKRRLKYQQRLDIQRIQCLHDHSCKEGL